MSMRKPCKYENNAKEASVSNDWKSSIAFKLYDMNT